MNDEWLDLEEKQIKRKKDQQMKIDKNMLNANIKLQDENNMLKMDIQILQNRIDKAIEFVKSMEYCGQEDYFYDKKSIDPCGNDNTFEQSKTKLLNILEGKHE